MSTSRILLTGATGFIGRHVIERLLARGHEVHAVTSGRGTAPSAGKIDWHVADLLVPGAPTRVAREAEAERLLHLAWHVAADGLENFRWIGASLELLDAFHRQGGRRAVFTGSCAEYDWTAPQPLAESAPRRPATPYGIAKDALGRAFAGFRETAGLSGAWARLFFAYGPGERPGRLVSSVITALLDGERAATTHGRQRRDYLYVGDIAEALVALLESDADGIVNLGSGVARPLRDLVTAAADAVGAVDRVDFGAVETRPGDVEEVRAEVSLLERATGWRPRYSLADGMAETVDWWRSREEER